MDLCFVVERSIKSFIDHGKVRDIPCILVVVGVVPRTALC